MFVGSDCKSNYLKEAELPKEEIQTVSSFESKVEKVSKLFSVLENSLEKLERNLKPVLANGLTEEGIEKEPEPPTCSDFDYFLNEVSKKLQRIERNISNINERCVL